MRPLTHHPGHGGGSSDSTCAQHVPAGAFRNTLQEEEEDQEERELEWEEEEGDEEEEEASQTAPR